MSTNEIKKVVREFCDAINRGDSRAAADFWAADAANHGTKVEHRMIEKLMESIVQVHEHYEVKEIVAEEDWVAFRLIVSGRHKATPSIPFDGGIYNITEPTGLPFTAQHIHMFRIVDGKIKEH